jgi:uncharacterized membrane protein
VVLLAGLAVAWLALLVTAPVLPVPLAGTLYAIGSRICHQIPARSFHLFGSQLPVCGRCLGIYAGAAIGAVVAAAGGVLVSRLIRITPRALLVLGGVPTALTLLLEWSGAWSGSNVGRAAAGVPLGAAAALVVAQALATLDYGRCVQRRPVASNRPPTPI